MPNCDYYAIGSDHELVLDFVFSLPCRVYELSSPFDKELVEFRDIPAIVARNNIDDWSSPNFNSVLLQLHPTQAGGKIHIERVELDSAKCDGAKFRYNSGGWGMIQLYLSGVYDGELRDSHTNHNSEKRALKWQSTCPELGPVADWDFGVVTSVSRKINRFIKNNSVAKYGARPIMEQASQYFDMS
jgi:hypothetical protein